MDVRFHDHQHKLFARAAKVRFPPILYDAARITDDCSGLGTDLCNDWADDRSAGQNGRLDRLDYVGLGARPLPRGGGISGRLVPAENYPQQVLFEPFDHRYFHH